MEAEKETFSQDTRTITFFISFVFISCFAAACVKFFYKHPLVPVTELAAFFILGCVYAVFMKGKTDTEGGPFSYSLFISAGLVLSLGILYFFKKSFELIDVTSLVAAFLLPNLIAEAWRVYLSTAAEQKPAWSYSSDIPEQPLFVYLENKPVRVELLIENESPLMINSVAPLSLKLGMAVFYILKKEAEVNAGQWRQLFMDDNGKPYKWVFYTKTLGIIKTFFNPEETLIENKIRSNAVIIAKRVE